MKQIICLCAILVLFCGDAFAQGPPITGDKPIMLGSGRKIVKTLTEVRVTDFGDFVRSPIMIHYLPDANWLTAVHLFYVNTPHGSGFGDINLLFKYQFYRRDNVGKTFRIVGKTIQILPTGPNIGDADFGIDAYQGYYALVAGYETIKHGIASEIGYRYIDGPTPDRIVAKLGFGLPLLKPLYPVNQINVYFENEASFYTGVEQVNMLISQGIQYARKQWTFEAAIQVPLLQKYVEFHKHHYSIYLGMRYVF